MRTRRRPSRFQRAIGPLGPNGGKIAAIEDDRFIVLIVTVGHRREVYD
jgi:hypothetical protein